MQKERFETIRNSSISFTPITRRAVTLPEQALRGRYTDYCEFRTIGVFFYRGLLHRGFTGILDDEDVVKKEGILCQGRSEFRVPGGEFERRNRYIGEFRVRSGEFEWHTGSPIRNRA